MRKEACGCCFSQAFPVGSQNVAIPLRAQLFLPTLSAAGIWSYTWSLISSRLPKDLILVLLHPLQGFFLYPFERILEYLKLEGIHKDHWVSSLLLSELYQTKPHDWEHHPDTPWTLTGLVLWPLIWRNLFHWPITLSVKRLSCSQSELPLMQLHTLSMCKRRNIQFYNSSSMKIKIYSEYIQESWSSCRRKGKHMANALEDFWSLNSKNAYSDF